MNDDTIIQCPVRVLHNTSEDVDRWLKGWAPGQALIEVHRTTIESSFEGHADDAEVVAEVCFHRYNAPPEFLDGEDRADMEAYRAKRLRSLSVGDVVIVGETAYACRGFGFEAVTLTNDDIEET